MLFELYLTHKDTTLKVTWQYFTISLSVTLKYIPKFVFTPRREHPRSLYKWCPPPFLPPPPPRSLGLRPLDYSKYVTRQNPCLPRTEGSDNTWRRYRRIQGRGWRVANPPPLLWAVFCQLFVWHIIKIIEYNCTIVLYEVVSLPQIDWCQVRKR